MFCLSSRWDRLGVQICCCFLGDFLGLNMNCCYLMLFPVGTKRHVLFPVWEWWFYKTGHILFSPTDLV